MCHHQDPKCFAEVVLCASMLCKSFKCLFAFRDTKQKLEDSEREKSIAEEMRVECQEKLQLSFRINLNVTMVLVHVVELLFTLQLAY